MREAPGGPSAVRGGLRILYVTPYTMQQGDHFDSGVIGYGATSGEAIVRGLRRLGHHVQVTPAGSAGTSKMAHVLNTYRHLTTRRLTDFDAIVMYNTHHQFAAEIRRILYERGVHHLLLAAYSHGSHWDPTDEIRHNYPQLRFADLGNVMALDIVLLVSNYMLDTMRANIARELGEATAAAFRRKAVVVGGTIDTDRLDAARTGRSSTPTIVFNHSPTPAKHPEVFFDAARQLLRDRVDVEVVVTRRFGCGDPGYAELQALRAEFGRRIVLGNTLDIDSYFRTLWQSHVQVSTATHESFGVSTIEAIYAGCCCVLPEYGSYPEVSGGHGVYRQGELSHALTHYLDDTAAREETARRQREAIARFAPESVAARIGAALERGVSRARVDGRAAG